MARNGDDVRTLLVAVAEATGASLSPTTIQVMMTKLRMYELDAVLSALDRCLMECKRPLTMADIVERMQQSDGRPGSDEAWAMVPKTEADAAVWTQEMSAAFFVARPLLQAGDEIAARMSFRQTYDRLVSEARQTNARVVWSVSAGSDRDATARAVEQAASLGRIDATQAAAMLPALPNNGPIALLLAGGDAQQALRLIASDGKRVGEPDYVAIAARNLPALHEAMAKRKLPAPSIDEQDRLHTAELKRKAAELVNRKLAEG